MAKKPIFSSGITYGTPGPDIYAVRELAKNDPAAFMRRVSKEVDEGKLRLSDFGNLRDLYRALADIQVPVVIPDVAGVQRSVMASAFPILAGTTLVKEINDGYMAIPTIGQELVTELDDPKKTTTIVAVHALDKNVGEVKEGDDFPEIGAAEEWVQIRNKRNGRRISITAEMIEENEIAGIVSRANAVGEIASDWIEEQTLARVTDDQGSKASAAEPYVYRPSGSGTALYSSTANTPGTRAPSGTRVNNNAFVDDSDLDACRAVLDAMKNNRGTRIGIPWSEVKILAPSAIIGKVAKIFNSEYVPGVENERSNYGPTGRWYLPPDRILSTSKMDDLSAAAWYMGAFQRQFKRKWKLRMEYVTLGMDTESYLRSRIAFQARVAWDCEIGAVDYVYVVQCIAATTAPGDE